MADIIDFPGCNAKNQKDSTARNNPNDSKRPDQKTQQRADRVAHTLLFLGLGLSAVTLCVAHAYHGTRRVYKKLRGKK